MINCGMKVLGFMRKSRERIHALIGSPGNILNLAMSFRAISLLLTSVFFLFSPQSPWIFKVGIVGALAIAALIIADLQRRYIENVKVVQAIVITETVGLTLLLIPTGGITSPFIWYALNPVLVAAGFLTPRYCWGALTFYLGSATFIASRFAGVESIGQVLEEKSYFYLVCLLVTLLVSLFSKLTRELDEKAHELLLVNEKLSEMNDKYLETMEHLMSFYHLTEGMTGKRSPESIMQEMAEALRKCMQSDQSFFWLKGSDMPAQIINETTIVELEKELDGAWQWMRKQNGTFTGNFGKDIYLMKVIRTSSNNGIIGVKVSEMENEKKAFAGRRPFEFIAELSEVMLERILIDQMMDQMLILEEQNRIANEIHDSVSQRLFGIVYSLHSLQGKSRFMTVEEREEEYKFLSRSAQETMKELRAAIYRLSSVKKGENPFFARIANYVDEYAKLNDVSIGYKLKGDESALSSDLKETIYRIICEACGNAVRHGNCKRIEMEISISNENTVVTVTDDGRGFQSSSGSGSKERGIGLVNMRKGVNLFGGTFTIEGHQGIGTTIHIEIPIIKSGGILEMVEL